MTSSQQQMNQTSLEVWNNFFQSAGIPSGVAHGYATKFSQHRIRIDMLQEISKEILLDMGIKAMGDIIAILRHAKSICAQDELKPSDIINPQATSRGTPIMVNTRTLVKTRTSPEPAPASSNRIQSRLSMRSGAIIASSSLNGKRTNSAISSSLAKRLAPAPSERKFTEKTLTVKYPSREAIAKAAQRISVPPYHSNHHHHHHHHNLHHHVNDHNHNHSHDQRTNSVKSRLGAVKINKPKSRHTTVFSRLGGSSVDLP